jgi:hypothetical protein
VRVNGNGRGRLGGSFPARGEGEREDGGKQDEAGKVVHGARSVG